MQQSQFKVVPQVKGDFETSYTEILQNDNPRVKVNIKQLETEDILKDKENSPKASLKCPDMNSDDYFGSYIAKFFLLHILKYMRWLKANMIDRSIPLQQNYLPNLSESQKNKFYSEYCFDQIDKIIKQKGKITRFQLFIILIFGKKLRLIVGVILNLMLLIVTRCALSVLLSTLIQANQDGETLNYQLFLGGMITIMNFASVMAQHNYYLWSYQYSNIYRMTIQVLVFNRLISLKQYQIVENQIGKVINMISSDMNTIEPFLIYMFVIPMVPLTFGLSGAILWIRFDGPIGLLLPVILLLCYPIQVMFQKIMINHVKQSKAFSDQRVKLTNELIEGIRLLKMYAWEEAFNKLILSLNNKEVYHHIRTGVASSLQRAICGYAQLWGSFVFFVIVHFSGVGELNIPIMASTIQLAFFFRFFSITLFSYGLDSSANIWINITRLESVLSTQPQQNTLDHQAQEAIILFKNYEAFWSKTAQKSTLKDINLSINQGEIISVVGRVGSGKTTLINSILEQIPLHNGELRFNGTDLESSKLKISHVEQEPFIFPDTIRNNILFGKEYNQTLYDQVIDFASLRHDLHILPHGDLTFIGEKGVNLSGGQRARVSVARALYQEADIYLFDDPLSAVDAKVAKHLFENAFKDYCLRKRGNQVPIVILATHQVQYAIKCDKIIVLDEGSMIAYGTSNEVQNSLNMIGDALLAQLQVKTVDEVTEQPTSKTNISANKPTTQKQEISVSLYKSEQQKAATLGLHTYIRFFKQWPSILLLVIIIMFNIISELCYQMMYRYTSMYNTVYSANTVLMILAGLMGGALISNLFKLILHVFSLMHANIKTHEAMLGSLCQSPVSYFDTTPSGRILNRFSSDKSLQDYVLHLLFTDIYELQSAFLVSLILISILQPYFSIGVVITIATIYHLIKFGYQMIIQTKEYDLIQKSPVFDFFKVTLTGIITINISAKEQYFKDKFQELTNNSAKANLIFYQVSTLFGYSVHLSCTIIQVIGIFLVIILNQDNYATFSQALLTLSIFCDQQQWAARQMIQVHALMGSTQRMYEIVDLPHEAPQVKDFDRQLNQDWPTKGDIQLKNVSMRYRIDTDLVLKGMSFQVKGGEKIGCVGRTGAGKSSILQALFRMSEIENSEGESGIYIDGIDIQKIGLQKLRSSIAIIPQSPFLFSGTIRRNLDPLEQHDDKRLYQVLDNVELKQVVDRLPQGLDTDMSEANQVFSVGQKQLVCLARAIIGNKKIVVLDEATANLDMRTDELIQITIKERFKHSTVITIAHRLNTVADYDKIIVVQDGKVLEMGSPFELLCENKSDTDITRNTSFANLVKNTGVENAKSILSLARKAAQLQ